jgi:hypothetical protein
MIEVLKPIPPQIIYPYFNSAFGLAVPGNIERERNSI